MPISARTWARFRKLSATGITRLLVSPRPVALIGIVSRLMVISWPSDLQPNERSQEPALKWRFATSNRMGFAWVVHRDRGMAFEKTRQV